MKWPSIGNVIKNIVEGRTDECSIRDFTPAHQEIMCSEYLRTNSAAALRLPRLARLLLLGRTMRDIDIVALVDDGSRIYAQVTYLRLADSKTQTKIQELRKYAAKDCHLILFCQCPFETPELRDSVHVVPLDLVYRTFGAETLGEKWLEAVKGR